MGCADGSPPPNTHSGAPGLMALPRSGEADRDLYSGLMRLHILHHAAKEPIFGLGMQEELARHGYRISLGTLYPLLQGLQRKGYLRSWEERDGRSRRRVFRATAKGHRALRAARKKIRELFAEIIGEGSGPSGGWPLTGA